MFDSKQIAGKHGRLVAARLFAVLCPGGVMFACGAESPEAAAVVPSSCAGEGCPHGGASLDETLQVELSAEGGGTGQVRYVLRNDGALAQRVLLRETPIGAGMEAFDVRLNGEPVRYSGLYVSWRSPTSEDLHELEPGEAVARTLDLTQLYDMTQPGQYSVKLLQLAGSTSYEAGQTQAWAAPAMREGAPEVVVSVDAEHVSVAVDESVEKSIFQTQDPAVPPGNCSTTQRDTIVAAEDRALTFLGNILTKRSNLVAQTPTTLATQLFQINFGATTLTDRTFVLDTYTGINQFITDTNYTCATATGTSCPGNPGSGLDCCTEVFNGATAVTAQPNKTLICPVFFENVPDSRASTLIHEAAHQNRTGPNGEGARDPGGVFSGVVVPFPSIHAAGSYGQYASRCTISTCF